MALTLSTNLSNALLGAAHRVAWGQLLCTTLGNTITLSCKRDSNASASDPYTTGVEFLNIGITAPLTYDSDTGDVTVGKLFGTNARAAADLSTGKSVFRIVSGSNYFQGTVGLPGSGADLIFTINPTLLTGFSLTSLVIKAPLALPINGNGVALGAKATDVVFQNTSGSTITNQVLTFGQVFKKGALPSNNTSLSLVGDTTLPTQMDVKTLYNDGSIKHAILSAVLPSLTANSSKSFDIVRSAASNGTPSPTVPSDFSGLTSVVTIVNAGITYTASLSSLLSGSYGTWISGDVASEWIGVAPLVTSGGSAHPGLNVRFNVRAYKGTGKARVVVIVENTKATIGSSTPINHYVYDISINVAGTNVFSKTSVAHVPYTRFIKTYWYGEEPTAHIRHNTTYLMATKVFPNYDPVLIGATQTSVENDYLNTSRAKRELFQSGIAEAYMPTTGGRPDIGLIPGWDAMLVLGMSPAMREVCIAQTALMGAWSTHYRDPSTDQPVSAIDSASFAVPPKRKFNISAISSTNPAVVTTTEPHGYIPGMQVYFQDVGGTVPLNFSDKIVGNVTATTFEVVGVNAVGTSYTSGGNVVVSNVNSHDTSHVPSVGFTTYALYGDHAHMEEMAFYASASSGGQLVHGRQLRAQAWTLRDQGHATFIMPDTYRLKGHFGQLLTLNVNDYNAKYVNNTQANKLGIIVGGSAWSDPDSSGLFTRTWQDDFFTQVMGRMLELGFKDFAPMFAFKAKYVVSRVSYCRMLACPYSMKVRSDNTSDYNVFATLEQAYSATYPPDYPSQGNNILAQVFDSAAMGIQVKPLPENNGKDVIANSMIGDPVNPYGYVANMQPALAYAVTHNAAGASAAWTRYDGRVLKQSNYGAYPEFAIVPRSQ